MDAELVFLTVALFGFLLVVATGRMRIDLAAILLMLALVLPWQRDEAGELVGILTVKEGFSGFGSSAVVMVVSMFVLSAAMERTGAASVIGSKLLRWASGSETLLLASVLVAVTLFSAVVSDTTSVLVWMPLLLVICRRQGYSGSRLLMPLAFAALLGGQWTLIGTRTNVVISDFLSTQTGSGLGFLSFTPIAVINWGIVSLFLITIGRRLLPRASADASLADRYDVTEYLTEVMATPDAEWIGKNLRELSIDGEDGEMSILGLIRGDEHLPPSDWLTIQAGDVVMVQGRISRISELLSRPGIEVKEELRVKDQTLRSVDLRMVEGVIPPKSELVGRSLAELSFHERYGLSVLAIGRGGRSLRGRPVAERLRTGDSLLLVGHEEMIRRLRADTNLTLLESRANPVIARHKAWILLALLPAMVLLAALQWIEPSLCVVLGATAAVVTGCIGMRAAYEAVDWRIVFVLGGMIPFGMALEHSGGAQTVAATVVSTFESFGPMAVFGAFLVVVILLTQVVENTAAAVVLAPVAYQLALESGANPVPFLLGTALCASAGFSSPMAHECTLLVMGPGGYRFRDYLRLGIPAALITWLVTWFFVPLFYPLTSG